jgi:hypothetical protein
MVAMMALSQLAMEVLGGILEITMELGQAMTVVMGSSQMS